MPKILSEIKKKQMVESFKCGTPLEDLSIEYGLKKVTIIKHLKNLIGSSEFKNIENSLVNRKDNIHNRELNSSPTTYEFVEISPLEQNFDFGVRKDLTSVPLEESSLPENIYMLVNGSTELEANLISDFPEYGFLSDSDQKRKVIRLFSDKKLAKSFTSKNQKLIKIPNGRIFYLASQFLKEKGITRIIFENNLLAI